MPSSLDALSVLGHEGGYRRRFRTPGKKMRAFGFNDVPQYQIRDEPEPLYYQRLSEALAQMADRVRSTAWVDSSNEHDVLHYTVSVFEAFQSANKEYSSISVDSEIMAGAPCIEGTRIPVYMVLDAIEHYGDVEEALRSYPSMTLQQVKDAIGFAKLVIECPLDDKPSSPA